MNTQIYQPLPVYHTFLGFPPHLESQGPRAATPETTTLYSPLTKEQIGSVESLPTNKATNVRNDGSVARRSQKRISCHLDILEARTLLADMPDNILHSTNNNERQQQSFPTTGNIKFVTDPTFVSPLLRKIKGPKSVTHDEDAVVTRNHAPTQNTNPYHNKTNQRSTKDKSVELYKTEWCRNWQELGVCR
jgi:hypothetical protein